MFSSKYDCWATPWEFFRKLNDKWNFNIDVCAGRENTKCPIWFDEEKNSLLVDWHEMGVTHLMKSPICYMNPPYGRQIGNWIKKAYDESMKGCTVVCLLPARTDTKWFHDYCIQGDIEFIKGRLAFGTEDYWKWVWEQEYINGQKNSLYQKYGKKNPAPFPSMIVTFKPGN